MRKKEYKVIVRVLVCFPEDKYARNHGQGQLNDRQIFRRKRKMKKQKRRINESRTGVVNRRYKLICNKLAQIHPKSQ